MSRLYCWIDSDTGRQLTKTGNEHMRLQVNYGSASNSKKLVLKSDLVPTSIDRYEGENEWVVINDYPTSDEIQANVKSPKASAFAFESKIRLKVAIDGIGESFL